MSGAQASPVPRTRLRKRTSAVGFTNPLSTGMDFGHYNCRDYHISPHPVTTTVVQDRSPFFRHESFDDFERRCRSPASLKPKFPLLKLPLELRQHIFSYLLPRTLEHSVPNPLANHARNFSAVKKRGECGMVVPKPNTQRRALNHVVWQRGNISILCVCRQLHDECAELLYGGNTFLIFVAYSGITFRFSWLLPSGLAPTRLYNFVELFPEKYVTLIKRVIVNIDHVDSYTGMNKFNVGGKGLVHGLRKQVGRLVSALQTPGELSMSKLSIDDRESLVEVGYRERRLAKIEIRVFNGNTLVDQIKNGASKPCKGGTKMSEDLQEMLGPFRALKGVRDVVVGGAVTEEFASYLETKMKSLDYESHILPEIRGTKEYEGEHVPQLCVYGNDL